VVNLLGSDRHRPSWIDLAHELTADRRALLATRLDGVHRWWACLPPAPGPDRRARTAALEPRIEDESTLAELEAALHSLAERRDRLCEARFGARSSPSIAPPSGRLLVCEFDMSIGGGEAEVASRSLFDVDDRPPWDLWLVAWGRTRTSHPDEPITCLLAWIPDEWFPRAEAGIAANPTRALYWADRDAPAVESRSPT